MSLYSGGIAAFIFLLMCPDYGQKRFFRQANQIKKMESGKIKFILLHPLGRAVIDPTVSDEENFGSCPHDTEKRGRYHMKAKQHTRVTVISVIALILLLAFDQFNQIFGSNLSEGKSSGCVDSGRIGISISGKQRGCLRLSSKYAGSFLDPDTCISGGSSVLFCQNAQNKTVLSAGGMLCSAGSRRFGKFH